MGKAKDYTGALRLQSIPKYHRPAHLTLQCLHTACLSTCILPTAVREYSAWPTINRKAIGAIAGVGALETVFLTYQKLKPGGLDLLCGASGGCVDVLNGPYSEVLVRDTFASELQFS